MCPRGRTVTNCTWQQQCTNETGQTVMRDGDMVCFSVVHQRRCFDTFIEKSQISLAVGWVFYHCVWFNGNK